MVLLPAFSSHYASKLHLYNLLQLSITGFQFLSDVTQILKALNMILVQ